MEDIIFQVLLTVAVFCFECCLLYKQQPETAGEQEHVGRVEVAKVEVEEQRIPEESIQEVVDDREVTTVLAALRLFQANYNYDEEEFSELFEDYFDTNTPLSGEEIDGLCERLNSPVIGKKKNEQKYEPEYTEEVKSEEVTANEVNKEDIFEIDVERIKRVDAVRICKSLRIAQKVNGKSATVGWMREQIKKRLQEEPEVTRLVIHQSISA